MPVKKGYIFKMKQPVGHFMVNTRQTFQIVEALLETMDFEKGDTWHYDPKGIISQRR